MPFIIFVVLVIVFLYPVLFGGKALLPADFIYGMLPWKAAAKPANLPQWNPLLWDGIAQFYPWRVFYARSVSEGVLPLWNPYQFCGTPFAANAQSAVFYPFSLIFVVMQPARAFGYSAALHLLIAGIFMFLLARRLGLGRFGSIAAGVTYAFSAFMMVWLELPTFVDVAAWLPAALFLILMAADGMSAAWAIAAGAALGLSVLAGHLQIASYVFLSAGGLWIWIVVGKMRERGARAFLAAVGLAVLCFVVAFLVASPQLMQTVELAKMSHRVRDVSAEGYARYLGNGIPIHHLATLFMPDFYGNPSRSYWGGSADLFMERAMYIGAVPLFLAIVGVLFGIRRRGVGFFAVLGLVGLLCALGTHLNWIFYYLLPGTSALGGPNRMIMLFCFSAAVLAGVGADWFETTAQEKQESGRRKGWRALLVGSAVYFLAFIAFQGVAAEWVKAMGGEVGSLLNVVMQQYVSFGALLLAGLGVIALYTAGYLPRLVFGGLIVLVISADLISFGASFNPMVPVSKVYPKTELINRLERTCSGQRLAPINTRWSLYEYPEAVLPPNAAMVYGFYDAQGYDSLYLRSYKDFVDARLGEDASPVENGNILFIKSSALPVDAASVVLTKKTDAIGREREFDFEADGVEVSRFKAKGIVHLEPVTRMQADAAVVHRDANTLVVRTDCNGVADLLVFETMHPGWRVWVDGKPGRIETFFDVFRRVRLTRGEHIVRFEFEPESYVVGMFLGLLGIACVGAAVGMVALRRRGR